LAAAVSFNGVGKRYPGGRQALEGITFDVEPGEMLFVTGHSGAGKSTLLKLVPLVERPTAGALLVNGQNVLALRPAAVPFLRRTLGLVYQDQKLLYDRSVLDNVLLPLQVCGYAPGDAMRRARAALDKVGLLERDRAFPVQLSGGEQQRLCVARAVVNRPGILIADEPTASLDADAAIAMMELFRSFNQVGVTVIVATHDHALVDRYATRAVRIDQGRLVA
jgi:cell division transport system ATP-binding protein